MRRPAAVFTIALTLGAIILATAPGALATTTISNAPPGNGHSVFNGFGVAPAEEAQMSSLAIMTCFVARILALAAARCFENGCRRIHPGVAGAHRTSC